MQIAGATHVTDERLVYDGDDGVDIAGLRGVDAGLRTDLVARRMARSAAAYEMPETSALSGCTLDTDRGWLR